VYKLTFPDGQCVSAETSLQSEIHSGGLVGKIDSSLRGEGAGNSDFDKDPESGKKNKVLWFSIGDYAVGVEIAEEGVRIVEVTKAPSLSDVRITNNK
jgi:hypothetical protein